MRRSLLISGAILLFILCLGLTRCDNRYDTDNDYTEHIYLNHHDTVKYVGMQTCRQCHSDKHATFIHTGMGMSFDTASRKKSVAGYHRIQPVYDSYKNLYYLPYWDNDALYVYEYRLEGKDTVHRRTEKISYIVGSGQHTNSHMIDINGFLYQAPVTWYAQEGRWDLPPGYENGNNSRFSRLIGMECMSCHNALPGFDRQGENHFYSIPDGIDCERCHGPGEAHVKLKSAGVLVDTQKEIDYSIVNPAKLSWELQVDVCQRCHLQGNAVLKDGKSFEDFRPGMKLSDIMDVFVPVYEGGNDEFIMASHAQRLQMSACFITSSSSATPLTCITCHDPHVSVTVTGKQVFNQACRSCHQEDRCTENKALRMAENDDCSKCHMPRSGTTDIPHVTVHDHYIRKPGKKGENARTGKVFKGLYAVNNPDPGKLAAAKAYLAQFEKFERDKTMYLDSAALLLSAAKDAAGEKIHLAFLKRDYPLVMRLAEDTWKGEDAWTSYRIARSYHLSGDKHKAQAHIRQAVKLAPRNLDFQNELATVLIQLENFGEAAAVLDKILTWQPKQPVALSNRGYLFFLEGNVQKAKEYYEKAISLDPDYIQAWLNLAGLHNSLREYSRSKKILTGLSKKYPGDATIKNIMLQLEKLN
jgi:predicted CXXCH cytochrome family protein